MDSLSVFRLPNTLPALISGKKDKTYSDEKKSKFSNAKVEKAINEILNNHLSAVKPDEEEAFLRFMRLMSRDTTWMNSNPIQVKEILKAATICFFNSDHPKTIEKIKKYVTSSASLQKLVENDINLNFGLNDKIKNPLVHGSSLLLSCTLPFFEVMLRGNGKEGNSFREFYKDTNHREQPTILLRQMEPRIATVLLELASNIKPQTPAKIEEFNSEDLLTLLEYADKFSGLDPIFIKLKEQLLDTLDKHPEKGYDWLIFAESINEDIELKAACLKGILKHIANSENLSEAYSRFNSKLTELGVLTKTKITQEVFSPNFIKSLINVLTEKITPASVEKIYQFANKEGLTALKINCLEFIAKSIDLDKARKVLKNTTSLKLQFLQKGDEHKVCELAVLTKLSTLFETPHQWDEKSKTFAGDNKELITQLNKLNPIIELLSLDKNYLQRLKAEDVEWMVRRLNSKLTKLDLSFTNLKNIYILERFERLEDLNLRGNETIKWSESLNKLKNLKELDLGECPNLQSLKFIEKLTKLKTLKVDSCPKLAKE